MARNATLGVHSDFIQPAFLTLAANATFEMNGEGLPDVSGAPLGWIFVDSGVVDVGMPSELPAAAARVTGTSPLRRTRVGTSDPDAALVIETEVAVLDFSGNSGLEFSNRGMITFAGGGNLADAELESFDGGFFVNESTTPLRLRAGIHQPTRSSTVASWWWIKTARSGR